MKKCNHKKDYCKHEKVEYCECCQKVVCKDCGIEWRTQYNSPNIIWHQPAYIPSPVLPQSPWYTTTWGPYNN